MAGGRDNPLQIRVARVTGGSRGTGAALVQMLAERGADVVINYQARRAAPRRWRRRGFWRLGDATSTIEELTRGIGDATVKPALESGATVFVGGVN